MNRFDPEPDFRRTVDGLEGVRIVARNRAGLGWTAHAKRTSEHASDAAADRIEGGEATWRLDGRNLRRPPIAGDELIDGDGRAWRVLSVQRALGGVRYVCRCRDLTQAGLTERATVSVGRAERGALGEGATRWQVHLAGVAVRLDPTGSDSVEAVFEEGGAPEGELIRAAIANVGTFEATERVRLTLGRLPRVAVHQVA